MLGQGSKRQNPVAEAGHGQVAYLLPSRAGLLWGCFARHRRILVAQPMPWSPAKLHTSVFKVIAIPVRKPCQLRCCIPAEAVNPERPISGS